MKINFTKSEYRLLVEMISMANWIMHSRFNSDEVRHKKYDELRSKIFSYYKEFNIENLIEPSNESDVYYETDILLNHIHENFISTYEDDVFWDELIHRLALRDVIDEIGISGYDALDMLGRMTKVEDAKTPYIAEFDQHNLKHVIIRNSDS